MNKCNENLANRLSITAIELVTWLRWSDPSPTLSAAQASTLAIIVHVKNIKPSGLAELENVKRPTVSRTISQLKTLGLIDRISDPEDARSVLLVPTKLGITVFLEGQRRRIKPLVLAISKLSRSDSETLKRANRVLETIIHHD